MRYDYTRQRLIRENADGTQGEITRIFNNILGLDIAALEVYHGYGGFLSTSLTPGESVELADLMIAKWQEFKEIQQEKGETG